MELDKRILPGKRPLTCFDTEQAKEFLGKECYLSSTYCAFEDLHRIPRAELQYISNDKDASDPYKTACYYYPFCLPCEWVKESEKKYRPYTLAEWIEQHEIGEVIHYRSKSEGIELRHMYIGYAFGMNKDITKSNVGTLTLDVASYALDYLLEDYEIEVNGEWQPFGVIDEEGAGDKL